jgi:hypothetical protein
MYGTSTKMRLAGKLLHEFLWPAPDAPWVPLRLIATSGVVLSTLLEASDIDFLESYSRSGGLSS